MLMIVDVMAVSPRPAGFEYRSDEEINGWPLIHINIGKDLETGRPCVAKGVVAIGNIAYGVVSIGVLALGVVSIGVLALGVVTLAGLGIGLVSLAGIAIGIVAIGGIALGYEIALGPLVLVATFALGVLGLG